MNLNGRVNGSPYHFVYRICISILGVALDGALDGILNVMLDGTLDSALDGMLVGVSEGADDENAFFVCDEISFKLTCR